MLLLNHGDQIYSLSKLRNHKCPPKHKHKFHIKINKIKFNYLFSRYTC